jgi:hypothetical protein
VFIPSAGYATYVADKDVDFTGTPVEAYAVTESAAQGYVHLSSVTAVPAGEAVLVKAAEGAYVIPTAAITPATLAGNLLKAADTDIVADGDQYILAKPEGKEVAFYQATNGTTIAAGKAYMEIFAAGVKAFYFDGDETTSLNEELRVKNEESANAIYDLQGRKVNSQLKKGLYIVNGKKVLK